MPQRDDESLIDEMRQAIRGDRERAAARGASAAPPPAPPAREPAPEPEPLRPGLLRRLLGR